jgi:hypothetical protein
VATTSCKIEASLIAKNIAALHSRLMEQPDATPAAAADAIRKMLTEIDRQVWKRINWLGGHYCPDWDQMWVDRKMPAWDGCTCAVRRRAANQDK